MQRKFREMTRRARAFVGADQRAHELATREGQPVRLIEGSDLPDLLRMTG